MELFSPCLLLSFFTLAVSVIVLKDDEFKFPLNCEKNESGKLVRNMGSDPDQTVAVLQDGVWKPGERYRGRIRENSSTIVFIRIFYTDSSKAYELSCGKRQERVSVEVLALYEVTGSVGETVVLQCFSDILDSSVLWQKNGTDLCVQNSGSDGCTDKRLSVSPNCSSHGDMSLTIRKVRPEDQGVYLCFKNQEVLLGVRLKVKYNHQQTQQSCTNQIVLTVIIIIIIAVIVIVAASILLYHRRSHRSASSTNGSAGVSSHETDPLQNHHPSQANGETLNAPSNSFSPQWPLWLVCLWCSGRARNQKVTDSISDMSTSGDVHDQDICSKLPAAPPVSQV